MIDIPQLTNDALVKPPYWTGVRVDTRVGALFVCPNGHTTVLAQKHDIDKLGYVLPMVTCDWIECGFSKHIRLNGWRRWCDSLKREA